MERCDEFRRILAEDPRAGLPPELSGHPETCADCREWLSDLQRTRAALDAAAPDRAEIERMSRALRERLAGAVTRPMRPGPSLPRRLLSPRSAAFRYALLPLGAAAAFLVFLHVVTERSPRELCVEIVRAEGPAEVIAGNRRAPARRGRLVEPGETVRTGPEARLELHYPDGTILDLKGDTELSLERRTRAKRVTLVGGELLAEVAEQPPGRPMVLTTPHAEAEVLGTRLTLSVGPDSTRLEVEEGRVRLTRRHDGRSVEVIAEHFAIAALGAALAAQPISTDWPQLGRNPQRWNHTPESFEPPPKPRWSVRLADIDIAHRVYAAAQVIVADGRCYIGCKSGALFALDAESGKVAWKFQAGGAILHTVGYEKGKVFTAAMDGCVYAVDARTGRQLWKFSSGRRYGFSTAVLLAEGKVFIADRGGVLYALDQKDGSKFWQYDAGAPVYQSAAYNDGRVYFGSEDVRVHSVSARDGRRLWRTEQLHGMGFLDYYPVVWKGRVIVRSWGGRIGAPYLKGPKKQLDYVLADPIRRKAMYLLDEKTGREPFPVPEVNCAMHGPMSPPAVTGDGRLVVSWQYVPDGWPDGKFCMGSSAWALMDPGPPAKVEILLDPDFKYTGNQSNPGVGAADETMIASVAGDVAFFVHNHGFRTNGANQGAYHLVKKKWCHGHWSPPKIKLKEGTHFVYPGRRVQNNTQGGGASAAVVAGGRLYHQVWHQIDCWDPKKR